MTFKDTLGVHLFGIPSFRPVKGTVEDEPWVSPSSLWRTWKHGWILSCSNKTGESSKYAKSRPGWKSPICPTSSSFWAGWIQGLTWGRRSRPRDTDQVPGPRLQQGSFPDIQLKWLLCPRCCNSISKPSSRGLGRQRNDSCNFGVNWPNVLTLPSW